MSLAVSFSAHWSQGRPDQGPPGPEAWKRLRAPRCTVLPWHRSTSLKFFRAHRHWNSKMFGYIFSKPAIFRYRNVFGSKMVEKFSLHWRLGPMWGPGPWSFSLTSLMDIPAPHVTIFSWMFTIACCLVVGLGLGLALKLDLVSGW